MKALGETFSALISQGGFIIWPMIAGTFVLWYALAYRWILLRRGTGQSLKELCTIKTPDAPRRFSFIYYAASVIRRDLVQSGDSRTDLDITVAELEILSARYRMIVRAITMTAPLAGLLGTVSGMIEMFDSLEMEIFYSQNGGVAQGISQALFTTQLGLSIAIPGMIFGRILDGKEQRLMDEVHRAIEYFRHPEREKPAS